MKLTKNLLLLVTIVSLAACIHNKNNATSSEEPGSTNEIPVGMTGFESDRISGLGIEHVIHISVDGLHPSAITTLGATRLPAFYRLRVNGSFTDNARTDGDFAYTLPNHTSQLTGWPVNGEKGHNWNLNYGATDFNITLHELKGRYVSSVFDVVHDFGLSTALYTSKSKFVLFKNSWDKNNAAIDAVLPDSGRNKIDSYFFDANTENLVTQFIQDLEANKYNYAFIHLADPDVAGHEDAWSLVQDSQYLKSVERVDSLLQSILELIDQDLSFKNSTVLILTADHGGEFGTKLHFLLRDSGNMDSGVVPFYIYGKLIPAGEDLYSWNPNLTLDPGSRHPENDDEFQPVRNTDTANLVLELLGLPNVPGSSVDNLNFPYF